MAINDPNHPENARIAQDVSGIVPPKLSNDFHGGRGVRHPEIPPPPHSSSAYCG